ncbi:MAG: hypothetical protein H6Q66_360 [Firmicutes bacterium]|nr:hypothetical protein [Bacillota bacterium]
MSREITIASLANGDVERAIEIMSQGADPTIFPYLIHSCFGYAEYVKSILRLPVECRDTFFFGAYDQDQLLGFSEWRRLGGVFLLSELFIAADARSGGIGKQLFEHGRELAIKHNAFVIELDVFMMNHEAREWYQRLGFIERHQTSWILEGAAHRAKAVIPQGYMVKNFCTAAACQKVYGFSNLEIESGSTKYSIGRLGDRYFRITTMENLYDKQLLSVLRHLDPDRRIVGSIKNLVCCMPDNFHFITKSIRMHHPL